MCGIAGWVGTINDSPKIVSNIITSLKSRGPDSNSYMDFGNVTLIHTRLKIIDLSENASQPMSNEDGTIWLIFNGEIYNFRSLKNELLKEHKFKSNSDTEVIIHLYEKYGEESFKMLNGMFAFCLYDKNTNKVFIARDVFGIKPLFYSIANNKFFFASELNALKFINEIDFKINVQSIYDYVSFFNIPAPQTFYANVKSLMPGEYLSINISDVNNFKTVRYNTWDYNINHDLKLDGAIDKTEYLLSNCVQSHLVSDVKIGALLSGGIDSSLICYYANRFLNNKLLTYNVKFPDQEYDETWAALLVANKLGTMHNILNMDSLTGDYEFIQSMIEYIGQPYCDTSIFAANNVFHLMRDNITVALTGDGGDEAFGGYNMYMEAIKIKKFISSPSLVQKTVISLINQGSAFLTFRKYLRQLKYFYNTDNIGLIQNFFTWIKEEEKLKLWVGDKNMLPIRRFFECTWNQLKDKDMNSCERILSSLTLSNLNISLLNDYLVKVDMASMKESLEVRVPFLSKELFEFALTIPYDYKIRNGSNKFLLREITKKYLPKKIYRKKKWGFGLPVDKWANDKCKHILYNEIIGKSSKEPIAEFLNIDIYSKWLEDFKDNKQRLNISREGLYQRIIMLYSLNYFLKKH